MKTPSRKAMKWFVLFVTAMAILVSVTDLVISRRMIANVDLILEGHDVKKMTDLEWRLQTMLRAYSDLFFWSAVASLCFLPFWILAAFRDKGDPGSKT